MRNRLSQARALTVRYSRRIVTSGIQTTIRGATMLKRFVEAFQPWGIVFAFLGLLGAVVAFMVESEDRQSERIFRAWDVVLTSTGQSAYKLTRGDNRLRRPDAGLRRGLEYLNRDFEGRWCNSVANAISVYVTGNDQRRCVFPRKPRELLMVLDLRSTSLQGVQLSDAMLAFSDFRKSFLINANFSRANLLYTDLSEALVVGVDFRGADFQNSILTKTTFGCTGDPGERKCTDLRGVKNLTCSQLSQAINWHLSYRDEGLSCGRSIPRSP